MSPAVATIPARSVVTSLPWPRLLMLCPKTAFEPLPLKSEDVAGLG